MKEAVRTIDVIISNLPDELDENDLEFVVDTSKLEVEASVKQKDGSWKPVPRSDIDIDIDGDVYFTDI